MKEILLPYILIVWLLVKLNILPWNLKTGFWSTAIGAWFVDYLSPSGSGGFYRFGDGQGTSCGVGTITRHQPVSSDRSDLCCA
ncbi:hypothetical protein ACK333_06015 [Aeromonas veronii]|uniref:hypothetical protein n=1 Tax=Aeromonas veronii TaxID=654 RepID=UPI003A3F9043